jgi:hypothetical protein
VIGAAAPGLQIVVATCHPAWFEALAAAGVTPNVIRVGAPATGAHPAAAAAA